MRAGEKPVELALSNTVTEVSADKEDADDELSVQGTCASGLCY